MCKHHLKLVPCEKTPVTQEEALPRRILFAVLVGFLLFSIFATTLILAETATLESRFEQALDPKSVAETMEVLK